MKKILFLLLTSLFFSCNCVKDDKIVYHEIKFTASSIELVKFNITDIKGKNYVKEYIDSIGRTKRLEFYNAKGYLDYPGSGYFGGPIIKYNYEPHSITETAYTSDIDLANDFQYSEVPNQIIYYLNKNLEIEETTFRYKIEFVLDKNVIKDIIENLNLYKELIPETGLESQVQMDSVFGYQFAIGKLKGNNPKSK